MLPILPGTYRLEVSGTSMSLPSVSCDNCSIARPLVWKRPTAFWRLDSDSVSCWMSCSSCSFRFCSHRNIARTTERQSRGAGRTTVRQYQARYCGGRGGRWAVGWVGTGGHPENTPPHTLPTTPTTRRAVFIRPPSIARGGGEGTGQPPGDQRGGGRDRVRGRRRGALPARRRSSGPAGNKY